MWCLSARACLAHQLYDERRPQDNDDLQQPLGREDSIEGEHRRYSLVFPCALAAIVAFEQANGTASGRIHGATHQVDDSQAVTAGRSIVTELDGLHIVL